MRGIHKCFKVPTPFVSGVQGFPIDPYGFYEASIPNHFALPEEVEING
jgi:hypothetical protein